MNLKTFLTINALLFIPFGVGMLLTPSLIFSMIDVNLDDDGLLMASTVGSMLWSFGILCLLARNEQENSLSLQALLVGNLSFHTIDCFLTFKGAYSGVMNSLGFIFSGMHLLFALGFLFYYLKTRIGHPVPSTTVAE